MVSKDFHRLWISGLWISGLWITRFAPVRSSERDSAITANYYGGGKETENSSASLECAESRHARVRWMMISFLGSQPTHLLASDDRRT